MCSSARPQGATGSSAPPVAPQWPTRSARTFYTAFRERCPILHVPRPCRACARPYAYLRELSRECESRRKGNRHVLAPGRRSSGLPELLRASGPPNTRTATRRENRVIRRILTYGTLTRRSPCGIGLCIAACLSWYDATGGLQTSNPPLTPLDHWSFERGVGG